MTQEVCLVVSRGSIGRELIIVPDFRDGTAEREYYRIKLYRVSITRLIECE